MYSDTVQQQQDPPTPPHPHMFRSVLCPFSNVVSLMVNLYSFFVRYIPKSECPHVNHKGEGGGRQKERSITKSKGVQRNQWDRKTKRVGTSFMQCNDIAKKIKNKRALLPLFYSPSPTQIGLINTAHMESVTSVTVSVCHSSWECFTLWPCIHWRNSALLHVNKHRACSDEYHLHWLNGTGIPVQAATCNWLKGMF